MLHECVYEGGGRTAVLPVCVYMFSWSCDVFYVYPLICLSIWLDWSVNKVVFMIQILLFIYTTSKVGPLNSHTEKSACSSTSEVAQVHGKTADLATLILALLHMINHRGSCVHYLPQKGCGLRRYHIKPRFEKQQ